MDTQDPHQIELSSLLSTNNQHDREVSSRRFRKTKGMALLIAIGVFATLVVLLLSAEMITTTTTPPTKTIIAKEEASATSATTTAPTNAPTHTVNSESTPTALHSELIDAGNWSGLHEALGEQSLNQMDSLLSALDAIREKDDQILYSGTELRKAFQKILREEGLMLIGDSTMRVLYGNLICLMDGFFDDANKKTRRECRELQKDLKERCQEEQQDGADCEKMAHFSNTDNSTEGLRLQFHPSSKLGEFTGNYQPGFGMREMDSLMTKLKSESGSKNIYIGMPCLHSLWSPGSREKFTHPKSQKDWPRAWQALYADIAHLADSLEVYSSNSNENQKNDTTSSHTIFVGVTTALCNGKLGNEKWLIDEYLLGSPLPIPNDDESTTKLISGWNHGLQENQKIENDYTGPIPLLFENIHGNHSEDENLFDEAGGAFCSCYGLKQFLDFSATKKNETITGNRTVSPVRPVVVDMHSATVNGCDDTDDGRHYEYGKVFKRQLSLLLRAITT